MAGEIAEQPQVLAGLLARSEQLRAVAEAITRRAPRFVLLTARGTSDHAALYAKYLAEVRLGLPAGLVSPSTMTLYGARPDLTDVLFIAVSQSGASPDLAESLTVARRCGASTVSVTNSAGSDLDQAAECGVTVEAGPEIAVAATKSYTAEPLALHLAAGDRDAQQRRPGCRTPRRQPSTWPEAACGRGPVPVRHPAGNHGPRVLLPDGAGGRPEAHGDQLPFGTRVLLGRPAARADGHGGQ
jgi:glucosamine--fructose-6-phosphate aminotransferase (isomerizing)